MCSLCGVSRGVMAVCYRQPLAMAYFMLIVSSRTGVDNPAWIDVEVDTVISVAQLWQAVLRFDH